MDPHHNFQRDRDNLLHQLDLQNAYWEEKLLPRLATDVLSKALPNKMDISITTQRKRKRDNLTEEAKAVMMGWINDHIANPYPTKEEKEDLSLRTGLTTTQISNWFTNARRRYLKINYPQPDIPFLTPYDT
jgi:hypothetical protein